MAILQEDDDIMIDKNRVMDNRRLMKKVWKLPTNLIEKVEENIAIIVNLE
ncbi:hypothetical protein RCH18_000342 [Flavobacterium sp. PL11]|jgi:mRNA interferase MazF|nr:hypothetical protein [Flavobacterium sp. PL11]